MTPGMTCGRLRPGSTSSRVPELQVPAKPDSLSLPGFEGERRGFRAGRAGEHVAGRHGVADEEGIDRRDVDRDAPGGVAGHVDDPG